MSNKKIVDNVLRTVTAQEVVKIDKGDFEGLKVAAQKYLTSIEIVSDIYKEAISKTKIRHKITAIYSQMRNETEYTREMLKYQHEFENTLNQFLGRVIYLTYVNDDGTVYFYDDANIGKLYATATANRGRGNISKTKIFDANDLQEDLKDSITESIAKRKNVYQTAIRRYHSNEGDEGKMNYNPSDRTFYWWSKYHERLGGWTDPIVNEGPIAEGYAGAVINEEPEINNNDIEHSLEVLWNNYIGKDSIGAALKGDIVYKKNEDIQFAVKKGSFSSAMVRQYINLAFNIQRLDRLTVEELTQPAIFDKMTKLTSKTDKIIDAINRDVTKELLEELSQVAFKKK